MKYVYPAIFLTNDDGSYTITYPDLPGCITESKSLVDAMYMAQSALEQWLKYLTDKKLEIPKASDLCEIKAGNNEIANLIQAEVKEGKAVRRTVSIPKWMDDKVAEMGLSLSRVLQEALNEKLRL